MTAEILDILNQFNSITLKEMDKVKLMERIDTKFMFNQSVLPLILKDAKTYYNILSVEEKKISRYKTLYFDTEDFKLYHQHHNGKLNRYKIRHRTYVENNIGFLEAKFKNNKNRTIKTRIKEIQVPELHTGKAFDFLKKTLPFDPLILFPKIWINYNRITLVNKTSAERLTLDINLEFEKEGHSKQINQLVIAEVKQNHKIDSPFITIMKNNNITEGSISKYCLGVVSLWTNIKKNNFKIKLSNIKTIIEHGITTNS